MLQEQVVLVTGGGDGVGRAIAIMMASRGAKVIVNCNGAVETPRAEEVVATIKAQGGNAKLNQDCVSDWEGAERMVQTAIKDFGRIDVVVNNAGVARELPFHETSPADFDAVIRGYLFGTLYVSRAAAFEFRKQERGCFVHLASTSGLFGAAGLVSYAAAKMGIVGLSNSLALELSKFNVRSNVIASHGHVPPSVDETAVAVLATLLASDSCKDVNGQIIAARGSEIHLYNHPRPVRFLHHKGGWTPEFLLQSLSKLEPLFTPVVSAESWMPWSSE